MNEKLQLLQNFNLLSLQAMKKIFFYDAERLCGYFLGRGLSGSRIERTPYLATIKYEISWKILAASLHTWAQFGGDTGMCPPTFPDAGDIICHVPPTFFSLGFVFGEVSKIKVMFVTFCVKSFSC